MEKPFYCLVFVVGVCVTEHYQSARSSPEAGPLLRLLREKEEGAILGERFGENGDQRSERWRKTLLDDISVSEGEMKTRRGEQKGLKGRR